MLKEVIDDKEKSQLVLIEDSVSQNGRGLLKSFINSLATRVDAVHIYLFDVNPEAFVKGLPENIQQKLHLHDAVSDPLGWDKIDTTVGKNKGMCTLDTDLCQHFLEKANHQVKTAIIIDSLSNLLLHRGVPYTCKVLNRFSSQNEVELTQVVSLVHRDVHDEFTINQVHHCVSTIMSLSKPTQAQFHAVCNTLHKKSTGKVVKMKEHFSIRPDFSLGNVEEVLSLEVSGQSTSEPDPTANLTFNLSLNDQAKEARSKLVLPYMHHKKETPAATGGAGKIFYQPDEADDFDEEDPDDDLDI